jgi:DNA repair protein RadC
MKREDKNISELKDSYFDGYEYKGFHVRTSLVIEGQNEYKPLLFSNPAEVYQAFKKLASSDKERFYSILLDTKNKVIGVEMVSQGSLNSSPVHPREAYKSALLASAASVIFVHSHPSGDPDPSESDREITRQLYQAGDLLGIEVLDHVIIGRDEFYSFSDRGELMSLVKKKSEEEGKG